MAVVGVLTAVILVLANLQTMADTLVLPSRREHPQQSIDKDIERNASLCCTCLKGIVIFPESFRARRTVALP